MPIGKEYRIFHTPLGDPKLDKFYQLLKVLRFFGLSLPSPLENFPKAHLEAQTLLQADLGLNCSQNFLLALRGEQSVLCLKT